MKITFDANGNQILKVTGKDLGSSKYNKIRGFSVQTLGNLSYTHRKGLVCELTTKTELFDYVKEHGTDKQKAALQTEEDFTLQNIRSQRLNGRPYWNSLNEKDIDDLVSVIGAGCRHNTKVSIRSGLNYLHGLDSSWVFDRIECYNGRWCYTAGQDYTYEMSQVRKVFI